MVPGDPEAVSVATAGQADSRDPRELPRPALGVGIPRAEAATSSPPAPRAPSLCLESRNRILPSCNWQKRWERKVGAHPPSELEFGPL